MLRLLSSESEDDEPTLQVTKRKRPILKLSSDEEDSDLSLLSMLHRVEDFSETLSKKMVKERKYIHGTSSTKVHPCHVIKRDDVKKVKILKRNTKQIQVGENEANEKSVQAAPTTRSVKTLTFIDQWVKPSQTECPAGNYKLLFPLMMPVYVPVPTKMFTQDVPVPCAVPVPVPTPVFIPTTCKDTDDFLQTCKKLKEELSEDTFGTELLEIAEAISDTAPPLPKPPIITPKPNSTLPHYSQIKDAHSKPASLGYLFVETATNENDQIRNNHSKMKVPGKRKNQNSIPNIPQIQSNSMKPQHRAANVRRSMSTDHPNPYNHPPPSRGSPHHQPTPSRSPHHQPTSSRSPHHQATPSRGSPHPSASSRASSVKLNQKVHRNLSANSPSGVLNHSTSASNLPTSHHAPTTPHNVGVKMMQFPIHPAQYNTQSSVRTRNIQAPIQYRDTQPITPGVMPSETHFQGHPGVNTYRESFHPTYPTPVDLLEEAAASVLMRLPRTEPPTWGNPPNPNDKKLSNIPTSQRLTPDKHMQHQYAPNLQIPDNQQLVNLQLGGSYYHGPPVRHTAPNDPTALNRMYLPTQLSEYQPSGGNVFQMRQPPRTNTTPHNQRYFDPNTQHLHSQEPVIASQEQANFIPRFIQHPPR